MDKSLLTKLVWIGALVAIPVAVLSLQKPRVAWQPETHRVITMDKPVALDISAAEVQGQKPLEPTKPVELPKPKTIWVGGGKITSKSVVSPPAAAPPAPLKDDHAALPAKDPTSLTASVATRPGPRAQ